MRALSALFSSEDKTGLLQKVSEWTENLILLLAGIYLASLSEMQTYFHLFFPTKWKIAILALLSVCVVIRWCVNRPSIKRFLIYAAVVLVYGLDFVKNRYNFILFLIVLTIAFADISWRKILKMFLCSSAAISVAAILCSFAGVIENFVYIGTERIRSSWGIIYPTDLAATVLFILFIIWALSGRYASLVMLPVACLYVAFAAYIPDGVNGRIIGGMFAVVLLFHVIGDFCADHGLKAPGLRKLIDLMLQAAFPFCAAIMLFLTWAYVKRYDFAVIISNVIHGRPQTASEAYELYGLHLFGTPYDQIGSGGSVIRDINYFFVDSTYPLILIRYGIAVFVLIMILWVFGTRRALQAGNRRLAWVMTLVCAQAMMEHHFTELNYNIFLVMPLASLGIACSQRNTGGEDALKDPAASAGVINADKDNGRRTLLHAAIGLAMAVILYLLFPPVISHIRTAVTLLGVAGDRMAAFDLMLAAILWVGALLWLYRSFCYKRSVRSILVPLLVLALPLVLSLLTVHLLRPAAPSWMDKEREALEIATAAAPERIYVSDLPDIYSTYFDGIGDSHLLGEDLGRVGDATVVIPATGESWAFISSGFLYYPLSEQHDLYSNDKRVIDALEQAGFHMYGYYSRLDCADMAAQASMNGLSLTEDGAAVLDGAANSMLHGPYNELLAGKYTVTFELHTEEPRESDEKICELRISSFAGQRVLRETGVYLSRLDTDGNAVIAVEIDIHDSRDVEYIVQAVGDHRLEVRGITWQRTPAQDMHVYYDKDRRKLREEYYDMTGEPILSSGGYFARDYGYDRAGNITEFSYYDTDNEPVQISAGYARLTRAFDRKKQKVSEAYFGADGEPVSINNGYASIAWEYDRRGNANVIRYYDEAGEPVMTTWGYAEVHRTYDRDRRITEETYFDAQGESCTLTNGQAGERRSYDDDDHLTGITYIDGEGKPFMIKPGYAMIDREYNAAGQVIREAYRDAAGEPVAIPGGYAATEREFDGGGRTSMMKHFDAAGEPYEVSGGYVSWRREYDAGGNVIRESYFDETGAPIANTSGYATIRREFDDQKHCLKETYYDASDAPVTCTGGYYGIARTFDGEGHVLRQLFIDPAGRPMVSTGRYAWWERIYDDNGDPVEERYYGRGRRPVANSSGVAVLKRIYDSNHLCVREAYFDLNGKLVNNTSGFAILRRIYNEDKRVVREERYGKDGKAAAPGGVFAIDSDYNERGQLILQGYTDKQEAPMLNSNGIAGIRYGYDAAENRYEDVYLDVDGNPCAGKNRIAIIRRSYEHRRNVREIYYDVDEKPVISTGGDAGIIREYDDAGNQVTWIHIDLSGKPVKNTSGIATIRREFDEVRNCVYEAYFDEKGLPCNNNKGISVIRRTFDADRNVTKEEHSDSEGKAAP